MSNALKDVIARAAKLPRRDQKKLAELWLTEFSSELNPSGVSETWRREIRRRTAAVDSGRMRTVASDDVRDNVQRLLKKKKAA